jgi:hypothetical protein
MLKPIGALLAGLAPGESKSAGEEQVEPPGSCCAARDLSRERER